MSSGKQAWIYLPKQVTDSSAETDFKTGDLSQFDSASAATNVTNVLPSSDSSFDASYQWVVRDPDYDKHYDSEKKMYTGTYSYTFSTALDMRNTNQWVTFANGQWGVANPSNSTGTQGVTITGYRALTADDIKDAGTKKFYVLIGYTKNGKSGSAAGTYDGYYVIPVPVNVTLQGKIEIGLTGNGGQTETYDGTSFGGTSGLDVTKFTPTFTDTNDGAAVTLTPTTGNELDASDFTIEQNGQTVTDPTNAGSYDVYLNSAGIDKIKKWTNASNYDWSGVTTSVKVGTLTISPKQLTVTNQGSQTSYYNGSDYGTAGFNANDFNPALSGFVNGNTAPTIPDGTFSSGDFYFTTDADTKTKVTPNVVGSYHVYLTGTAISNLQKIVGSNYALPSSTTNSWGTFTISEANQATATLGGNNSMTYTSSAVTTDNLNNGGNIAVTITVPGASGSSTTSTYQLKDDDYTWTKNNADGTTTALTSAPKDVGNYTITLTTNGQNHVKAAITKAIADAGLSASVTDGTIGGSASFSITPASAAITQKGSGSKTYDGSAAGVTIDELKNSSNWENVPEGVDISGLTGDDFDWYSADGTDLGKFSDTNITPKNVGSYIIALNSTGLTALKNANPNYTITVSGNYSYQIQKATVNITQSGSGSKTYDGNPVSNANVFGGSNYWTTATSGFDISNIASVLNDSDFDWYDASGKDLGKLSDTTAAPTNAGSYTIKLNSAGTAALQAAYPNYDVTVTGQYNYTIQTNVTFQFVDDDNNGSVVKSQSQGMTIDILTTINPPLQSTLNGLIAQGYKLVDGQTLPAQYTVKATDSNVNNPVITYHLVHNTTTISKATAKGATIKGTTAKLAQDIATSDVSKAVTRTITDEKPSGTVKTTQSVGFTRSAIVDMVTGNVTGYNNWTNADTNTNWTAYPVAVPGYTADIEESVNGGEATKIDSIDAVTPTGTTQDTTITITYTAQEQSVTIKFVDDETKDAQGNPIEVPDTEITKTGTTDQSIALSLSVPQNYKLATNQTLPTSYKFTSDKNQVITIHLVHKHAPASDTKTVTETIHYRYADGAKAADDHIVTVTFTRSGTRDEVTNVVSWGPWSSASGQFPAIVSPTIKGYTPDFAQIDAQTVQPTSNNLTFTVTYTKQPNKAVSDTKTITETIHYRYADGSQAAPDKVVKITYVRQGSQDPATDEITWGVWTPAGEQVFPAVTSPVIAGYTADQLEIAAQTVDLDSNDLDFVVTYTKNADHGGGDHNGGSTNNGSSNGSSTNNGQLNGDNGGNTTNGKQNQQQAQRLPQTGNMANAAALTGLGMLSLAAMLGIGKKRRHE